MHSVARKRRVAHDLAVRSVADVTENFIEGSILFDDQDDVANFGGKRRSNAVLHKEAIGGKCCGGELLQIRLGRHCKSRQAATVKSGTVLRVFERPSGIRAATLATRIHHPHAAVCDTDARGIQAHRQMSDHNVAGGIDHADSVDAGFGHEQPFRGRVVGHTGRQEAAERQQPRNAQRNVAEDFVVGRSHYGNCVGMRIGNVKLVVNGENGGWRTASGCDAGLLACAV